MIRRDCQIAMRRDTSHLARTISTSALLSPWLAALALGLLATQPLAAAKPERGAQCTDGIDNDGDGLTDADDPGCQSDSTQSSTCQIDFAATFDDLAEDGVRSDGRGPYSAFTGSGNGFSLDTNGIRKLETPRDDRKVILDFGRGQDCEGGWADRLGFCSALKGVNMVFDLNTGGLDLCSLGPGGDPGAVSLHVAFLDAAGNRMTLTYGCLAGTDGTLIGSSLPAMVSRIDDSTWRIVGQTACLHEGGIYGEIVDGTDQSPLTVPFGLTLVDIASQ